MTLRAFPFFMNSLYRLTSSLFTVLRNEIRGNVKTILDSCRELRGEKTHTNTISKLIYFEKPRPMCMV